MKKTFMTLVIICMLAVLLTGCTGANNDNDVIPDLPNASPYASPYDMVPDVSPNAPGYGNDGGLVSPMPDTNVPGYGGNGNMVSPVPQLTP